MAGLNLLAAIVIYWNTVRLEEAIRRRKRAGLPVEPELLTHVSPLGWVHILLTDEYRWPGNLPGNPWSVICHSSASDPSRVVVPCATRTVGGALPNR